jgi:hypothetical protein
VAPSCNLSYSEGGDQDQGLRTEQAKISEIPISAHELGPLVV